VIEPERALRDVRASLREQVLPSVGSSHGRTILAAALGILDSVADQVERGSAAAEATVAELLPALAEWQRSLAGEGPAAGLGADRVCAERDRDPFTARATLLTAAERTIVAAWELPSPRREQLLRGVRRVIRADVERQL
jgi:hypothetical protein